MTTRSRTAPAALALLAVLSTTGLAACGGDEDSAPGSSSSGSPEVSEPSATGTPASPDVDVDLDETQEVSTDQVTLRIPEGWKSLDAGEALADAGGEQNTLLTTIAERLGVPREQLVATLENVDLLAVANGGARGGVLTNLNVLHQQGELPNEAQFALQLAQFADETGDVSTVSTAFGDVLRADYTLAIGEQDGRFEVLLAQAGSDLVTITITSADADDAAEIADLVVATLDGA
ncbi:hypothetical protein I601_0424 [Nocardioides dokdonensis FR1436]|uniref:Lipoprotein n=1 Tax=Nocardioides dokdonensis FR1436 TaxID=1300347 RepID=A0A1A9GFP1_9ACTN|nr:hypothetical protein [Nocardioides dokdonensis]ANH36876.1 hypothetical protein I601_0424 [Nocardioides dokdonensis FR1436]